LKEKKGRFDGKKGSSLFSAIVKKRKERRSRERGRRRKRWKGAGGKKRKRKQKQGRKKEKEEEKKNSPSLLSHLKKKTARLLVQPAIVS
jgi:hypothetical protein